MLNVVKRNKKTNSLDFALMVDSANKAERQEYDETKIVEALVKEANCEERLAKEVAVAVTEKLQKTGIELVDTSLIRSLVNNELLERGLNKELRTNSEVNIPFYNIIDIIKNSETCIFYIMPAYSETDITQSNKVKEIPNIKTMKISSRRHGVPMFTGNLNNLLSMNITRLNAFFDTKQGKVMGMISISIELTGLIGTINCIKKEIIKIAKKYIRK